MAKFPNRPANRYLGIRGHLRDQTATDGSGRNLVVETRHASLLVNPDPIGRPTRDRPIQYERASVQGAQIDAPGQTHVVVVGHDLPIEIDTSVVADPLEIEPESLRIPTVGDLQRCSIPT